MVVTKRSNVRPVRAGDKLPREAFEHKLDALVVEFYGKRRDIMPPEVRERFDAFAEKIAKEAPRAKQK